MIVTPQYVRTKWNVKNKSHYESKGYSFTKYKDEFEVNVLDLTKNNTSEKIRVICDYCNKIYKTTNSNYNVSISKIEKSCCSSSECMSQKREEINLLKYNVKNVSQLKETRVKVKKTNFEKYGVEYISQLEETKKKIKKTNLERYGVEHTLQSEDVRDKGKKTLLLKYGVDNYTKTEEYIKKTKETSLKKYGVDSPNKSKIVQQKKNETMYLNGTTKTSRQQKYLHNLFGGILNYPVNKANLDIAFVEEKIYIEYDGSGHDLCVKKDSMSRESFETKERKRYYALKHLGWKSMRIISNYDKLPNDETLLKILTIGLEWLNQGHNWINFIIDENMVETAYYRNYYDFGEIKKIAI